MSGTTPLQRLTAQQLIERARANHAARMAQQQAASASPHNSASSALRPTSAQSVHSAHSAPSTPSVSPVLSSTSTHSTSQYGIELNEKQLQALELVLRGKSINLIGAAGTGKTTTTRIIVSELARSSRIHSLESATKHLPAGAPAIAILGFANKAVNNIKKHMPPNLQAHCLTFHKLLESSPINSFTEEELYSRGIRLYDDMGEKLPCPAQFLFARWKGFKLPHLATVFVEESSMVSWDLFEALIDALPRPEETQFIFLGDLNQLPPIYNPSILGFKITELHTVELTHVYRQALESPIITLAHRIRKGEGFWNSEAKTGRLTEDGFLDDRGPHGRVQIRPWKKKLDPVIARNTMLKLFILPLVTSDGFDFNQSVFLCPFNKTFGTIELNKGIADALGKKRGAVVHEVIARGMKSYWAIGDRVIVEKQEAEIIDIFPTPYYTGQRPAPASKTLDRWGRDPEHPEAQTVDLVNPEDAFEAMIAKLDNEEKGKNKASHTIKVRFFDDGQEAEFDQSGTVNSMIFSYVLTVHKSQGSEWRDVYILLHGSHNSMCSRELLYTAVTRARQNLFIVCEPDRGTGGNHVHNQISRASRNPEIKGVTLEEKAAFFAVKRAEMERKKKEMFADE